MRWMHWAPLQKYWIWPKRPVKLATSDPRIPYQVGRREWYAFWGIDNCALSTERRRSLLIKIGPKLRELASTEAGAVADGGLVGDPFIKELSKFVTTFSSLYKVQESMCRVLGQKILGGCW